MAYKWQPCNASFAHKLMPTSTGLPQPIKELKVDGPNSERIVPQGGSTTLKISVRNIFNPDNELETVIFGYAFLMSSRKTWTT